jgi:hypothetical protein
MAPRTLVSRLDTLTICASPKASCRSVADFAWEVAQVKTIRLKIRANVIVFRNPYRRLISAYLNKYVEHTKYREASLRLCPGARLDSFEAFVDELHRHGFRCVDKTHFKPQLSRYRGWRFDRLFNAEDLAPLTRFVNGLFGTEVAMPFRVAGNRPKQVRGLLEEDGASGLVAVSAASALTEPAELVSPWQAGLDQLQLLLLDSRRVNYGGFYNESLQRKARLIYQVDFNFLDAALKRGWMDAASHAVLTTV